MNRDEHDPLLAELRDLPGPSLSAERRQATLLRAEAELERRRRQPARSWLSSWLSSGSWYPLTFLRWLTSEALVPSLLVLVGLLYLSGALRELSHVFGPERPARALTLRDRLHQRTAPEKKHLLVMRADEVSTQQRARLAPFDR